MSKREYLTVVALRIGIAVPLLYFGTQIIAALFYPNYSFWTMPASLLGSDRAIYPALFNAGALLTGIATILAAVGFLLALQRRKVNQILAWLTAIALLLNGFASLWAGFIPLPDPRHAANPFTIGVFAFPALLAVTLWKQSDLRWLKVYLVVTILLFIVMIPIMSGITGIDIQGFQGFLQRIVALIFFPPIGVGAYFLLKHGGSQETNHVPTAIQPGMSN